MRQVETQVEFHCLLKVGDLPRGTQFGMTNMNNLKCLTCSICNSDWVTLSQKFQKISWNYEHWFFVKFIPTYICPNDERNFFHYFIPTCLLWNDVLANFVAVNPSWFDISENISKSYKSKCLHSQNYENVLIYEVSMTFYVFTVYMYFRDY
jgi:hypothetical protein